MAMIFFIPDFLKEGEVVFRQFFEECLLTHPSDLVSAAGLFLSQDTKVETDFLKDLHKGFRYILSPGIVGWGAAHVEQSIRFFFSNDLYGQVFCPVHASVTEPSPWVSVKEGMFKGISYGRRDIPLACQDISDTHDHFNVLDPCRATKGTGTAGRARPELGPFQDLRQIGLKVRLPHKPSHVQGRPEFERTSTRARPALDAEVELEILNEGFRVDFHLKVSVSQFSGRVAVSPSLRSFSSPHRNPRSSSASRHQPFDFSEHLVLGKMFLRGSLAGTDGCAGPAAFAERLMDHGDPLVLKKLNSRIGTDFNT